MPPPERLGISDVVTPDQLTPEQRAQRGGYVGCIVGALTFTEYRQGSQAAGFADITITSTHQVAEGMHSAAPTSTPPSGTTGSGNESGGNHSDY